MSLRSKVVILLSAVMLAYAAVDHALQKTFVYGTFEALEEDGARHELERVKQAIESEIESLVRDAQVWARSPDSYQFPSLGNGAAYADNWERRRADKQIDLLYLVDQQGGVAFGRIQDSKHRDMTVREFPSALDPKHPLLSTGTSKGVYMTEKGPLLFAAERLVDPVDPNEMTRGTIIVGRFLDNELRQELMSLTMTWFDVWPIDDPSIPEVDQRIVDEAAVASTPVLEKVDDEHLSAYTAYLDFRDHPALLIRAKLDRKTSARGAWAVRYALFSTIAAGLLMMLVLLNMLQRTVLKPLAHLTEHAVEIGRSDDFTKRVGTGVKSRNDEVGILTREFDSMIEKVAESRAALVDTARAAGMSEIATGVLHNVGNVLNSVNVSATLVAQKARGAAPEDLKKVMDLLRPNADDLGGFIQRDPRGKHLYPLLDSLATQLVSEQSVLLQEVSSLTSGIEHIKELVQAQQGYAGRAGVREVLSVAQLIDAAVSITESGVPSTKPIEFVRELEPLPAFPVDRHRIMEILVNLIQNARQAVLDSSSPSGRITFRLAKLDGERLRIEVADDGVGIPAENLSRVFNHGFTTKKGGHGFGLHASANAATEMKGKLTAASEGPGRGATFVLEFPVAPASPATLAGVRSPAVGEGSPSGSKGAAA
jgi:signal transduction histidine kinase